MSLGEVPVIHRILDALPGVDKVSVDVLGKTATIVHAPRLSSPTVLMDALNKGGLKASIIACVAASSGKLLSLRTELSPLTATADNKHHNNVATPVANVTTATTNTNTVTTATPNNNNNHHNNRHY